MLRAVLLAFVLVLAAFAAPASAADVGFGRAGLTIVGAPGEGSRLTVDADSNFRATVRDDADGLRPGPGCVGTSREVTCGLLPFAQCFQCIPAIDLGDASDTLVLSGTAAKGPFLVDTGAGDDVVQILADASAIVRGGPGNDALRADGISELDGGEGADLLQGDRAYASYASRSADVFVTLDGVANDGLPGERDNAATGSLIGGDGEDALTGDGTANELRGGGGDDFLAGGDGADALQGDEGFDRVEAEAGDDRITAQSGDLVHCGGGADVALGLSVPGTYGDCETVFETYAELPYLSIDAVTVSKRRPRVALGWHQYPGIESAPVSAFGVVEMRYRSKVIARGKFTELVQPAQRTVGLTLTARGRALACRSARNVRLLVVATGQAPLTSSRSAIRRGARLPRVGRCAKQTAKQR